MKIILWVLFGLFALDILLVGLLFVPAIQTFVVNKITQGISKSWGTELSIKDVHLTPSLRLVAHEVRIKDDRNNDMIFVGTVNGRLRGITLKPFKLKLGTVTLENADVVLRTYKGEEDLNIVKWSKKFVSDKPKSDFTLTAKHLNLVNSRFVYANDNIRKVYDTRDNPDIDYAFFELKDINWDVDNFVVYNDSVAAKFNHLAFNQYGGFSMKDGQGAFSICSHGLAFNNLKIQTAQSFIDGDLNFHYDDWEKMGDFTDSVRITAKIRPSTLCMSDVAGFAPALKGMSEVIHLTADRFDGTVNDFHIIKLLANCGFSNRIHGDLALKNITDPSKVYVNAQLDSCTVNVPSLALFTLPGGKKIPINNTLKDLGQTDFDVSYIGTLTDFDADLAANTALGAVKAQLASLTDGGQMQLQGNVTTNGLNIGKITKAYGKLGSGTFDLTFNGEMNGTSWSAENLKTLKGHLGGDVAHLNIYGYPLRNTTIDGEYANNRYDATLVARDPHIKCTILGQLDLSEKTPLLQGNISMDEIDLGAIANAMPKRDSATAEGLDKVIYTLQKNPTLKAGFDDLTVTLRGSNIDDVSGYVGCDNIRVYNNGDSLTDGRFRVTSINTDVAHKIILSSNIANASVETNHSLASAMDSIMSIAHNYFPTLIDAPKQKNVKSNNPIDDRDFYVKAHASTYRTRNILKLIFPDVFVAPNSTVDLELFANNHDNIIQANIPLVLVRNKVAVYRFALDGKGKDDGKLALNITTDSVAVGTREKSIIFDKVSAKATSNRDQIDYDINWHNNFNKVPGHDSKLAGIVDISEPSDLVFKLRNTLLYLNDMPWDFNEENSIHLKKKLITVDNLVIDNDSSQIFVNGDYSNSTTSNLNVKVQSLDMSIANALLSSMSFGGSLSADVNVRSGERRFLLGKVLADNFVFNDAEIGDLFLMAGWNEKGQIGFNGGFFHNDEVVTTNTLADYDVRKFKEEEDIFAHIQGSYTSETKYLQINTDFDTLNAAFLDPFLSGFSDHIRGTASGKLAFYSSPETAFMDGTVRVLDANMGIAALGTSYDVKDQDIHFNWEGISFNNMLLTDGDGNQARLNGTISHRLFNDMKFDLRISTPGIMVLNTDKSAGTPFYGKGYVSGEVTITGDDELLKFRGNNLKTLPGSKIYLLVSSASSASESNIIHFKTTTPGDTVSTEEEESSSIALDFDFTFNVTDDADIVLLLESVGGTLNARSNGSFRLTYNETDDLNLYGNLELHKGDIRFSFYNIVNPRFTLVPGGSIVFNGPLDEMVVKASAYKSSKTSLASIIPEEYLTSTGTNANANVDAYIHLNGEIMKNISPTFSFELPNTSAEVRNLFYNALDTTNTENMTKQFAYFMVTNNFLAHDNFTSVGTNYTLLSNLVNNMLSNLMEKQSGSFGIIYNQATETTSAEYGIKANADIVKDRVSMSTSIGYYDDRTADAGNNMYGDFTIEYNINKAGTWKLKAYTYIGEHDENYYYNPNFNSQINYTAGVGLAYKQNFDSSSRRKIRKMLEANQRKAKGKDKNKKQ